MPNKKDLKSKHEVQIKLIGIMSNILDIAKPQESIERLIRADLLRRDIEQIYDYIDKQLY